MEFRNTSKKVNPYFMESEFFCKSADYSEETTVLSDELVNGIFIIREHFEIDKTSEKDGVIITSTKRTKLGNKLAGGKDNSKHLNGEAGDFKFSDPKNHEAYQADILNGGPLFQKLRKAGITAFGIYDSFNHIDCADYSKQNTSGRDHLGKFKFWDERSKKKNLLK